MLPWRFLRVVATQDLWIAHSIGYKLGSAQIACRSRTMKSWRSPLGVFVNDREGRLADNFGCLRTI